MGKLEYLSPTTFIRGLNCVEQIRLLKVEQVLSKDSQEQTMPMATGIAFDGMVKCELNKRFKLKEVLAEIRPENARAIEVAEAIMQHYKMGPLQSIKAEGIGYTGIDEQRDLTYLEYTSVCRGKPDVVLTDGTVIDWKVQGAFSSWGAQPKAGYCRSWVCGKDQGTHINADFFMEQIDFGWAVQLYLYARLMGHHPGKQLRVGIEQVAVDKDNTVRIQSYRNFISYQFQLDTELKFHKMYKALNEDESEAPHYHDKKCIQYRRLCAVANYCSGYKQFQIGRANLSSLPVLSQAPVSYGSTVQVGDGGLCFSVRKRTDGVQPNSPLPSDSSQPHVA